MTNTVKENILAVKSEMWLAVDSGNSRIKWALIENNIPISIGSTSKNRLSSLTKIAAQARYIRVSFVGTNTQQKKLRAALSPCKNVLFLRTHAKAAGVINHYSPPSSLGIDRWLALIAARVLARDVIVVDAGTATTIDALSRDGDFLGGVILPGETMMQNALKHVLSPKRLVSPPIWPPQNTASAMASGVALAVSGSIIQLRRLLLPGAKILLTGGNSEQLLPWLPHTTGLRRNLVIEGIIRLCLTEK